MVSDRPADRADDQRIDRDYRRYPDPVGAFSTIVTATAANKISGTAAYSWDIATALTATNPGTQQATVGAAFSKSMMATGGTTPYVWSAVGLPAGLTISSSTGVISGTPSGASTSTTTVTVTDAVKRTSSVPFTFTTVSLPLLTNPGPQAGATDTAVSKALTVSGGTTPYAWTATGLPAGLAINVTTGVISGTPTAIGEFNVTVTVTDAAKRSSSASFVWTVASAPKVISPGSQRTVLGQSTSLTLTTGGGTAPFRWSATGLPSGLSIDATTGVVSGIPTTAGTNTTTVTLTDAANRTSTASFSWVIALAMNNPGTQNGTKSVPLSLTPTVTGGKAPYTWTATGLPAGLAINKSTGAITGAPTTVATYTTKVVAIDASGITGDATFTWAITVPIVIGSSSLDATVGVDANLVLQATGGSGSYTWSVTGLPAGLRLDTSTGVISGKAADIAENYVWVPVTVRATDAAGRSTSLDTNVGISRRIILQMDSMFSRDDTFRPSAMAVGAYTVQIVDLTTGQVTAAQLDSPCCWLARLQYKATGVHTFVARIANPDGSDVQATSRPVSFDFDHTASFSRQALQGPAGYELLYPSSGAVTSVTVHAMSRWYLTNSPNYLEIVDGSTSEVLKSCANAYDCSTTVTTDIGDSNLYVTLATYDDQGRRTELPITDYQRIGKIDFGAWWVKTDSPTSTTDSQGKLHWSANLATNRFPSHAGYYPLWTRLNLFDATTHEALSVGCRSETTDDVYNGRKTYPYIEDMTMKSDSGYRDDALTPVTRCHLDFHPTADAAYDPGHGFRAAVMYDQDLNCTFRVSNCGTTLAISDDGPDPEIGYQVNTYYIEDPELLAEPQVISDELGRTGNLDRLGVKPSVNGRPSEIVRAGSGARMAVAGVKIPSYIVDSGRFARGIKVADPYQYVGKEECGNNLDKSGKAAGWIKNRYSYCKMGMYAATTITCAGPDSWLINRFCVTTGKFSARVTIVGRAKIGAYDSALDSDFDRWADFTVSLDNVETEGTYNKPDARVSVQLKCNGGYDGTRPNLYDKACDVQQPDFVSRYAPAWKFFPDVNFRLSSDAEKPSADAGDQIARAAFYVEFKAYVPAYTGQARSSSSEGGIRFDSAFYLNVAAAEKFGSVFDRAYPGFMYSLTDPDVQDIAAHVRLAQEVPQQTYPRIPEKHLEGATVDDPLHRLPSASGPVQYARYDQNDLVGRRRYCRNKEMQDIKQLLLAADPSIKYECDEYPMRSTYEGAGRSSYDPNIPLGTYSVQWIKDKQNNEAGLRLNEWYDTDRILDGDAFFMPTSVAPLS